MARHNELCDGVSGVAGKALTPAHMRDDPKISTGYAVRGLKEKCKAKGKGAEVPIPEEGEEKGDLLIRDIWTQGTDSIHDIRVVNNDAVSYQSKTPEKCLESAGREKKKNLLNACLNKILHFTTFVTSLDDLITVKAEATLKHIASRLAQKWK